MTNLRTYSNNSVTTGIFPLEGGGQTGASQLNPGYNAILDSVSPNDSVQLPFAIAGTVVVGFIQNWNSNALAVFAKEGTSDVINPFFGPVDNTWQFTFPANGFTGFNQIMVCTCAENGVWICNFWPS